MNIDTITDTILDLSRELASADAEDLGAIRRRYADMISAWEADDVDAIDALNTLTDMVSA